MTVVALPQTIDSIRRILTYSRVSSDRLLGAFGQEDEVRAWAEREGYEIIGHRHDTAKGIIPIQDRQGLISLLHEAKNPHIDAVAMCRLDRLARDENIMLDAVDHIWNTDTDIITLNLGLIPRGPAGRRLAIDEARRGADEIPLIVNRLQAGRRAKARRGGYIGGSLQRPYGRQLVTIQGRREYVPIPEEQAVIARMIRDHKNGLGWRTIARALNDENIPTATGAPWHGNTIRYLAERGPLQPSPLPNLPKTHPHPQALTRPHIRCAR